LKNVEGRKLLFAVEAFDELEKIGEGEHERFVVDRERFTQKAQGKRRQLC
jgi:predicted thioesterase